MKYIMIIESIKNIILHKKIYIDNRINKKILYYTKNIY